jgi:hypothetical protein
MRISDMGPHPIPTRILPITVIAKVILRRSLQLTRALPMMVAMILAMILVVKNSMASHHSLACCFPIE